MNDFSKNFQKKFWKCFIVIIFPIIILGFVANVYFSLKIAAETKQLNYQIMLKTKNAVNSKLMNVITLSRQISKNDILKNVILKNEQNENITTYELWEANRELKNYYDTFYSVGIYLKNAQMAFDGETIYSFPDYYNRFLRNSGKDGNWWLNKISNVNFRSSVVSNQNVSEQNSMVTVLVNVPLNGKSGNSAVLVVHISEKDIVENSDYWENTSFAILDSNGDAFFKTNNFNAEITSRVLNDNEGEYRSRDYTVIFSRSIDFGVKYVFAFVGDSINGNMYYFIIAFFLIILFGMGISAYFALFSLKQLEKPLIGLINENQEMNKTISEQIDDIHAYLFESLLYNVMPAESWKGYLNPKYVLDLTGESFIVITIKHEITEDNKKYEERINSIYNELYRGICKVAKKENVTCRGMKVNGCFVIAFGFNNTITSEVFLNKLQNDFLNENVGIFIGVGELVNKISDIYKSYECALIALENGISDGTNSIVFYDKITGEVKNSVYYTKEKEIALIKAIGFGAIDNTKELLDEIYIMNFEKRRLKSSELKRLIANLSVTMYKVIDRVCRTESEETEKFLRVCQNVLQYRSSKESFDILREMCISLCKVSKHNEMGDGIETDIINFIEDNYADAYLSLNSLAKQLDLNYHYLSRLFKERMGVSFTPYLLTIRMEKAKHLIETTDLTVKQIAVKVGFTESNTFIRAYKKYFGVTPGEWKKT